MTYHESLKTTEKKFTRIGNKLLNQVKIKQKHKHSSAEIMRKKQQCSTTNAMVHSMLALIGCRVTYYDYLHFSEF